MRKGRALGLSFILHSFIQAMPLAPLQVRYYLEALPTQHGYCTGVTLYAARTEFGPTTLRSKGFDFTTASPRPTIYLNHRLEKKMQIQIELHVLVDLVMGGLHVHLWANAFHFI